MTMTFKSYVDLPNNSEAGSKGSDDYGDNYQESHLCPVLLKGEMVIARAQKVLKFTALSQQKQGITGSLFVTNFKLSFVTADTSYKLVDQGQRNSILGPNDVCLINIDGVCQASKDGVRRKKLEPGTSVSHKVKTLQIYCRDFRVFTFSFKFSCVGDDKKVVNALLHHAFPLKPELLFAYESTELPGTNGELTWKTRMYDKATDWEDELKRLECTLWRVSAINQRYASKTYPSSIVVPGSLTDSELTSAAAHFPDYRIPIWSWGNASGCVILRTSGLPLTENSYGHQIYDFIRAMKKAHPYGKDPVILNLDDLLPSPKEIYLRFTKLKELCTPESVAQFVEQDSRFLNLMESSQWLHTVSSCINVARQVASKISSYKVSVILKEAGGRDLCCLVSSLAQIVLDPFFRSITGFQSLIQKEWVAMGHPFLTRLGRLKTDENESPVFLLFLDCVWQLLQQFPASFEYTETYLTTVWDAAHVSVFDTFLFDCEMDRKRACLNRSNQLEPRSVWNWGLQFSKQQALLFVNPLYTFAEDVTRSFQNDPTSSAPTVTPRNRTSLPPDFKQTASTTPPQPAPRHVGRLYRSATLWSLKILVNNLPDVKNNLSTFLQRWTRHKVLPVHSDVPLMKLWRLCYFRWMPPVQVVGGGPPTEYMEQCRIIKEIKILQRQIASLTGGPMQEVSAAAMLSRPEEAKETSELVTSAFPFSAGGTPWAQPGITLSVFRQSSCIQSDEELEGD